MMIDFIIFMAHNQSSVEDFIYTQIDLPLIFPSSANNRTVLVPISRNIYRLYSYLKLRVFKGLNLID